MSRLSYSPYQVPGLIRTLTKPWLTWEVPGYKQTIFLTFDDGPDPDVTPQVMRILQGFGAKATFFLTGSKASHEKDLVRQLK
jgi:peptidoglycan-N-acetylglucosamine deacetylase